MSTRSTTHFTSGQDTVAIVYRHPDGYPEGHGRDLQQFFADVEAQTKDTRFNDPSYLAAKLVVWLADIFATHYVKREEVGDHEIVAEGLGEYVYIRADKLDFLSVGVVQSDPSDIDYRYVVDCSQHDAAGRPLVTCWQVGWDRPDEVVPIPEES